MRSIESEGDSIDEAIGHALRALQVERDRVEIEILSDANPGLFRLGRKKARIRATLRAPVWQSPGEETAAGGEPPVVSRGTSASVDFEGRCTSLLRELLDHLGVECTVAARRGPEAETLILEVSGDGSGLVIGRRGQTLDAIEYMVNRIASRGEELASRVTVDVEGYRARRQEYLEALAKRLADKAKHSDRAVTLNPMSPRDRRIVHLALKDDPEVETRSQGEGHYRQLLILPAGRSDRRPRTGSRAR